MNKLTIIIRHSSKTTYLYFKNTHLVLLAAALSYMTTLALLPLLAFCFYFYKMFGGVNEILVKLKPFIFQYFAPSVGEQVFSFITESLIKLNFETIGITGLIVFLITSFYLLSSVENVINEVWKIKEKRSFFRRWIRYFSTLIIAPTSVAILFSTTTIANFLPFFDNVLPMSIVTILILTLFYNYLPNCKVSWRASLFAALISSSLLFFVKHGYSYYLKKAFAYDTLYGSLAVLPIMQLWVYLIWLIILFGVIISAIINSILITKH